MAVYEYLCRDCQAPFEVRKAIGDTDSGGVTCPRGHIDVRRMFSVLTTVGARGTAPAAAQTRPGPTGGCCGGACGCGR
jgi:putative FmdB family regulatory protein